MASSIPRSSGGTCNGRPVGFYYSQAFVFSQAFEVYYPSRWALGCAPNKSLFLTRDYRTQLAYVRENPNDTETQAPPGLNASHSCPHADRCCRTNHCNLCNTPELSSRCASAVELCGDASCPLLPLQSKHACWDTAAPTQGGAHLRLLLRTSRPVNLSSRLSFNCFLHLELYDSYHHKVN